MAKASGKQQAKGKSSRGREISSDSESGGGSDISSGSTAEISSPSEDPPSEESEDRGFEEWERAEKRRKYERFIKEKKQQEYVTIKKEKASKASGKERAQQQSGTGLKDRSGKEGTQKPKHKSRNRGEASSTGHGKEESGSEEERGRRKHKSRNRGDSRSRSRNRGETISEEEERRIQPINKSRNRGETGSKIRNRGEFSPEEDRMVIDLLEGSSSRGRASNASRASGSRGSSGGSGDRRRRSVQKESAKKVRGRKKGGSEKDGGRRGTGGDREGEVVADEGDGTAVERKIYMYPTRDGKMVTAATKAGASERAIAATVWIRTQPQAKWDAHSFDLKYDWERFWMFLQRISMDIDGEETGPGFDGRQLQELRAIWALPALRTKETLEKLTTWSDWRRRDYTGMTLRDFIFDTEEQPVWEDNPTTYGLNMILSACDRMAKALGVVASRHFRKAFSPLEILRKRKFSNIADGVILHLIHEAIAAFAFDVTQQKKTTGPKNKTGELMDTARRAARALRAHVTAVAVRLAKGLVQQDSTTTVPHIYFFKFVAPAIKGYSEQHGGQSWNAFGLGGRAGDATAAKQLSPQPASGAQTTPTNQPTRPCMWHVASLTDITTKKGIKLGCRNPRCGMSHETVNLDAISPAPTKEDIRRWDAGASIKTKLTEAARQLQPEWV